MKHKVRGRDGVILKPAPLLKQNTERGHYNCGDVSASYGGKLFGAKTSVANMPITSPRPRTECSTADQCEVGGLRPLPEHLPRELIVYMHERVWRG
jgi:hypothetical protein